jgi:hypothetical protein
VESSLGRRIFGEEGEEGSSPAIFSCTFPNFENCNCNHVKKGFNCLSNRRNSRRMCQKKREIQKKKFEEGKKIIN